MNDTKETLGYEFDIAKLSFTQLMALRTAVDERLDRIRSDFIDQASAMGLACSIDGKKPRGRKPKSNQRDE